MNNDPLDSYTNLINGDLSLVSNYWWDFGAGTDLADIVTPNDAVVINHLTGNNNQLADPMICGISRTQGGIFNPTLVPGSPALTGGVTPPTDPFFENVTYHGAFNDNDNWAAGWSALDEYGFLINACVTSVDDLLAANNGYSLSQNTPNPANEMTTFEFAVPTNSDILIELFDINGRLLSTIANDEYLEGTHNVEVNVSNLANGTYFVSLRSNAVALTQKMTVLK